MRKATLSKPISFHDLNGNLITFEAGQPIQIVADFIDADHLTIEGERGQEADDGYIAQLSSGDLVDIASDEFTMLHS